MELNSKGAINQKYSIKTAKVQGKVLINSMNSANALWKGEGEWVSEFGG